MRASAFLVAAISLIPAVASAQTHYGVTQGWCASNGGHFRATGRVGTDIGECTILPNAGGTGGGGGGSAPGVSNAGRNAAMLGLAAGMLGLIGQMIDQSNSIADREYRDRQSYEIESGLAAQRVALESALHDAQYADSQRRAAAMDTLAERMKLAEREMDRSLATIKEKINANAPRTTVARANPFARPGSPATPAAIGNQGVIRPAEPGAATRKVGPPPETDQEIASFCRSEPNPAACVSVMTDFRNRGIGPYRESQRRYWAEQARPGGGRVLTLQGAPADFSGAASQENVYPAPGASGMRPVAAARPLHPVVDNRLAQLGLSRKDELRLRVGLGKLTRKDARSLEDGITLVNFVVQKMQPGALRTKLQGLVRKAADDLQIALLADAGASLGAIDVDETEETMVVRLPPPSSAADRLGWHPEIDQKDCVGPGRVWNSDYGWCAVTGVDLSQFEPNLQKIPFGEDSVRQLADEFRAELFGTPDDPTGYWLGRAPPVAAGR